MAKERFPSGKILPLSLDDVVRIGLIPPMKLGEHDFVGVHRTGYISRKGPADEHKFDDEVVELFSERVPEDAQFVFGYEARIRALENYGIAYNASGIAVIQKKQ